MLQQEIWKAVATKSSWEWDDLDEGPSPGTSWQMVLPYEIVHGYRSDKFYVPKEPEPFAFLNIGMFARFDDGIPPGQVFTCVAGCAVERVAAPKGWGSGSGTHP